MGQLEQYTGGAKPEVNYNEGEVFKGKMHAQEELMRVMVPKNVDTFESGSSSNVNQDFQVASLEWVGKYAELFSKIWKECLTEESFLARAKADILTDEDVNNLQRLLVERAQQTTDGQSDTIPAETLH